MLPAAAAAVAGQLASGVALCHCISPALAEPCDACSRPNHSTVTREATQGETDSRWANTARPGCSRPAAGGSPASGHGAQSPGCAGALSRAQSRQCTAASALHQRCPAAETSPGYSFSMCSGPCLWQTPNGAVRASLQCVSQPGVGLLHMLTAHAVRFGQGICHNSKPVSKKFCSSVSPVDTAGKKGGHH